MKFGHEGARNFRFFDHGARQESDSLAERLERLCAVAAWALLQGVRIGIQKHVRPMGSRQRPFVFVTMEEAVELAHLQKHAWLVVPAMLLAFQKSVEEAHLQVDAVVCVEEAPVFKAMHLQPLVARSGLCEGLKVATWVDPLTAPVGARQQWDFYVLPAWRSGLPVLVVKRMRPNFCTKVCSRFAQSLNGMRFVAAHPFAGDSASRSVGTQSMLNRFDLLVVPVGQKGAQDTAVVTHVPVEVGAAFPCADRTQMRGLQCGDLPLVHCVIGNAVQPDFSVGPGLCPRPLNAVVEVPCLAR